jgi:hypothetical protein
MPATTSVRPRTCRREAMLLGVEISQLSLLFFPKTAWRLPENFLLMKSIGQLIFYP